MTARRQRNALATPSAFRKTALAFPDRIRAAISVIEHPDDAQKAIAEADVLANYAKRLKADTEAINAIQHGRLMLIDKMAAMVPRGSGGRGKKNLHTDCAGIHRNTWSTYWKIHDNADHIDEYAAKVAEANADGDCIEITIKGFLDYIGVGDALAACHPDLADAVRRGAITPAAAHREARRREVGDKVAALPEGKHVVIYADPPWQYTDKCDAGSVQAGGCERHYPSMSLSELKALAVSELAADDSVLFLWVTVPLLPDALELAKAWGFAYKTHFVWDKVKHNMGHYSSVRHELLLVCTRGSCTPQNVKLFDSVQSIERTKHSEKPERFREFIDVLYPNGRKLELFARSNADGWTTWGNEAEPKVAADHVQERANFGLPTAYIGNNADLVRAVSDLYVADGDLVADVTYGKGVFWSKCDLSRFELYASDLVEPSAVRRPARFEIMDFRETAYEDETFDHVIIDPPYVHYGKSFILKNQYQNATTTERMNHTDIIDLYAGGMKEAYRILKKGGKLWIKCQDEIESGRQRRNHIEIYDLAIGMGLGDWDDFVLVNPNPPIMRQGQQLHARKNHSFLWVFQKRDGRACEKILAQEEAA